MVVEGLMACPKSNCSLMKEWVQASCTGCLNLEDNRIIRVMPPAHLKGVEKAGCSIQDDEPRWSQKVSVIRCLQQYF